MDDYLNHKGAKITKGFVIPMASQRARTRLDLQSSHIHPTGIQPMKRLIVFLVLFLVVGYLTWPYYTLYRLDGALGADDPQAVAPFVDPLAIQASYKARIGATLKGLMPESQRGSEGERLVGWLAEGLRPLGEAALEQTITVGWVRDQLRAAALRATDQRPAYFMAGIDRAFFQSWNRFGIHLGPPDQATEVVMSLQGLNWRVTDIR